MKKAGRERYIPGLPLLRAALLSLAAAVLCFYVPYRSAVKDTAGGRDAVSAASVLIPQPSGTYVIYVNTDRHPDPEKLATWETFFSGGEISYVFEDISCQVIRGDAGGLTMAESFRSRLPENQMTVNAEEGTFLLSKADAGRYDILILSKETAEAYHAETVEAFPGTKRILLEADE